ncbi:MAG: acyltransferase [Acidocella sp.]|nr:acyltransferase [Acidocella sp.]
MRGMVVFGMERRIDLDQAKGLAIMLVVFGHLVARADPVGVEWYEPLRRAVYAFHMPFFFYLSGLVSVLTGAAMAAPGRWRGLLKARAWRLQVPCFGIGLLSVLGKWGAAHFMFVDHAPKSVAAGIASLVWHTADSADGSIWYLFVLFVVSVSTPVLLWADGGRLRLLVAVATGLYFLPLPPYVYADHVGRYAIFFVAGVWAGRQGAAWTGFIDAHYRGLIVLLAVALLMVAVFGAHWPVAVVLLPVGLLSMPALHGFVRHRGAGFGQVFHWLGRYCFMIYLFNTIFIGLTKGVLLRFISWDGPHFMLFAVALMVAGVMLPVALKFYLLNRVPVLRRLTD